jgi:hypothetical protein
VHWERGKRFSQAFRGRWPRFYHLQHWEDRDIGTLVDNTVYEKEQRISHNELSSTMRIYPRHVHLKPARMQTPFPSPGSPLSLARYFTLLHATPVPNAAQPPQHKVSEQTDARTMKEGTCGCPRHVGFLDCSSQCQGHPSCSVNYSFFNTSRCR